MRLGNFFRNFLSDGKQMKNNWITNYKRPRPQ